MVLNTTCYRSFPRATPLPFSMSHVQCRSPPDLHPQTWCSHSLLLKGNPPSQSLVQKPCSRAWLLSDPAPMHTQSLLGLTSKHLRNPTPSHRLQTTSSLRQRPPSPSALPAPPSPSARARAAARRASPGPTLLLGLNLSGLESLLPSQLQRGCWSPPASGLCAGRGSWELPAPAGLTSPPPGAPTWARPRAPRLSVPLQCRQSSGHHPPRWCPSHPLLPPRPQ